MEPVSFLGQITLHASMEWPPTFWTACAGQLLPIRDATPLFQLLGTRYGGDGVTTFALPDLRGQAPIPGLAYHLALDGEYPIGRGGVEAYLGMIALFPYAEPPKGWAACEGQQLAINQNTALDALLNTRFGGDGRTTFALPDLRGKAPAGQTYSMALFGSFPAGHSDAPVLFPLGAIVLVPYTEPRSVPSSCLACEGQVLKISDYESLAALAFPGTGETFALPDLRARVPMPGLKYLITAEGDFPKRWNGTRAPR